MTTFTWAVTALYTEDLVDKPDYVVIANYLVLGVDGTYGAELSNIAQFSTTSVNPFIPYDELTEEIVIGWIQQTLGQDGIDNIYACIQGQIDSQINPPVVPVNTPLPWVTP